MKKLILLILTIFFFHSNVHSIENEENEFIEKDFNFKSYDENFKYNPPTIIEDNGSIYELVNEGIKYKLEKKSLISSNKKIYKTLEKINLTTDKNEDNFDKIQKFKIDNKFYDFSFVNAEYTKREILRDPVHISKEVSLPISKKTPSPKKEYTYSFFDEIYNNNININLSLSNLYPIENFKVISEFKAEISVSNYTDNGYYVNDIYIPNYNNYPNISEYEDVYLEKLGLDPNIYRITSARWSDQPSIYDNEKNKSRKMIITGQKYYGKFNAVYTGSSKLPNYFLYDSISKYELNVLENNNMYEYDVIATVTYKKNSTITQNSPILNIKNTPNKSINNFPTITFLGILLIFILSGVVYILVFRKNFKIKIK